jgi:UDP-glucose:(heptosyl)LPS alpha-1,3-glucosyltransferase
VKIALIRQRYNAFGGAERFVERAVQALAAEGSTTMTLLGRYWGGETSGAGFVRCDPYYIGRTWRDWSFARAACAAVAAGSFDLVQSHERIACCDIYRAGDGVHAQWLENRASVLGPAARLAQAISPWHRYTLAAERRLFASPRLKAVICNSRMVADEVKRHFGVDESRLELIYNGVDLERFHPRLKAQHRSAIRAQLGIPESSMMFLLVGSGFERKGVPALLEAFARDGVDGSAHLVIVGADRHATAMQRRAQSLGIAARTHFPGPQRDVAAWYAAADCFVLPTLYDPFPNAVLEAMACGLPVITSRQCGAAELISTGHEGWSCDAWDVDALAAHLSMLNIAQARKMGLAARLLAERFPLDAMAAQLVALYRRLLPSK